MNGAENHVPVEREEQQHFFHGLMDAELSAAELMARNSHEHPEMPWDFHVDMARQNWDEVRHARLHDLLMKDELGCAWATSRSASRTSSRSTRTTCWAGSASSTARASRGRCGATRTGARR